MNTGWKLRQLVLTILCQNNPSQLTTSWQMFKKHLCDNLKKTLERHGISNVSEDMIEDYGLYLMEN
ncbi:hypothetical protein EI94DRAFT_1472098, partial [Lactarius quietus]